MAAVDSVAQLKKTAEGREVEIFEYGDGRVLRLYRPGRPLEQAQAQAAILQMAADAGVRVPAVHGVVTVDGRHAIILERIEGDDLLEVIARSPWRIVSLSALTARLHAEMHQQAAPPALPPVRESHRRAIARSGAPGEFIDAALTSLDRLTDGDRLLHGDFHPGNVMLGDQGPVIIDWSNAMRGSPEADFARTMMMLRLGEPPPGAPWLVRFGARFARALMIRTYNGAYRKNIAVEDGLFRAWQLPVAVSRLSEGIAEEREKLHRFIRELIARDAA